MPSWSLNVCMGGNVVILIIITATIVCYMDSN